MTVECRPLTTDDTGWVARLFQANARDNLSEEQRRTGGFVQGKLGEDMVAQRVGGPASVAAVDGALGVGALLTASIGEFREGPPALVVEAAREAGLEDAFLYGPAVVDANRRGGGILRAMNEFCFEQVRRAGTYRVGVGFVEESNTASAAAHARLGWSSVGRFEFRGRGYDVIAREV